MATLETAMKVHMAETGDVESAYQGGLLRIYNAAYAALLSEHSLSAAGQADGTVVLTVAAAVVEVGISAQDAVLARIYKADGTTLLHNGFTVGTIAAGTADVQFDDNTGWNAGDNVAPGNITADLTGMTISVA